MTNPVLRDVSPLSDAFRHTLDWERLPTDDIEEPGRLFFSLGDDERVFGYVGLEGTGPDALLRSLVVKRPYVGQGYGRLLVEHLEELCRRGTVERLHLLTNGAAPFFRRLGYVDADRASAPPGIAGSAQFRSLCPASASYMVKALTV
jgi:N-acetylglutamate synthase-like GNAT family acetyltransferase